MKSGIYIPKESGIYKIYWDECSFFYYGQSVNLYNRHKEHKHRFKKSIHNNKFMQNVFNKYGDFKIEIVQLVPKEQLDKTEQYYINNHFGKSFCCNLSPSAETCKGKVLSDATKEKIRITKTGTKSKAIWSIELRNIVGLKNKGINNGMYGKKITEKAKEMQREKLCGKNNYLSKLILNINTGIYYDCLTEAAFAANIDKRSLWQQMFINKKKRTDFIYV